MTEKINWKYKDNDRVVFNTVQSDLLSLNGCECVIERRITEDEADLFETGPMYRLKLVSPAHHGRKIDAFEDELTPAGKITWRDIKVFIDALPDDVQDMPAEAWLALRGGYERWTVDQDMFPAVMSITPYDEGAEPSVDNPLSINLENCC